MGKTSKKKMNWPSREEGRTIVMDQRKHKEKERDAKPDLKILSSPTNGKAVL